MNEEIWKSIPGYENYYVASNLGRIKSLSRTVRSGRGYKTIPDTDDSGFDRSVYVNRLYRRVCYGVYPHLFRTEVIRRDNNNNTDSGMDKFTYCRGCFRFYFSLLKTQGGLRSWGR